MKKKIAWGEILYINCLDKQKGLPSIPDKSIDVAIADFPFNVKFKGTAQKSGIEEHYSDNMSMDEYIKFCKEVFYHLQRISKGQIIFCGERNQQIWYKYITSDVREEGIIIHKKTNSLIIDDLIKKYKEKINKLNITNEEKNDLENSFQNIVMSILRTNPQMVPHFAPNRQGRSSVAYLGKYDPILFYGEFNGRLPLNVIVENVKIGKHRELKGGKHPCPGCSNVYRYLLNHLKPKSIIDPFMGSGTTMQIAIELNIKWTGYELDGEKFKGDIERRQRLCRVMNILPIKDEGNILDFM